MQQKASKTFTYQTRPKVDDKLDKILTGNAHLLSKVERHLFKDHYQNKKNINELKSLYLKRFGITARQFNSCRIKLEGKIRSYKELLNERIPLLESKIKKLKMHIKKLKDPFKCHQKKRRLFLLEKKLEKLKNDKAENKIRLCFGSKKLFRQQFHLEENDFSSHEKWQKVWKDKRNDSFFLIGSKDETAGNQTCQLIRKGTAFSLCIRLPDTFSEKNIIIENITFAYGQEEIINAIEENEMRKKLRLAKKPYSHLGKAINYLFKKDKKSWRIFISIEKEKPALISKKNIGMIGLDINANHLALVETDRFGNIVDKKTILCSTYGKDKNQSSAIIGNAAKEIIKKATQSEKPLVLENLKFEKKKQHLREENKKYSRMLSSFSYNQIISSIETKAFKEGIEVYKVNPAYTSIIGRIKFANKYGLSIHHSAAFVIARRPHCYSEKLPRYLEITDIKSSKSAFFLPARNRKKHVWSLYSEFNKMMKAANVLHLSTNIRSSRPLKLLCDNQSIIYWGSSGTLIVNKTARLTGQNKSI